MQYLSAKMVNKVNWAFLASDHSQHFAFRFVECNIVVVAPRIKVRQGLL